MNKRNPAMRIGSEQWSGLIASGSAAMGITVTSGQIQKFARHAELLLAWNRKINLTAITDPEQIAIKHYLDTLAALPHVPPQVELLDIGTGGGFPGIPFKIMRPLQPMILIDSLRKRISFVKETIRMLALDHIEALHIRAEELAQQDAHRLRYGAILCRALTSWPTIVSLALPLLAPDGRIVAFKGPQSEPSSIEASLKDLPANLQLKLQRFSYRLPLSGDLRTLIVLMRHN